MGYPNMDLVVRECRAVIKGPMVIIRLGTCGTPSFSVTVGTLCLAEGSVCILRNYDAFLADQQQKQQIKKEEKVKALNNYYHLTKCVESDKEITELMEKELTAMGAKFVKGLNASSDTYYGSQGRKTNDFADNCDSLIEELMEAHPKICSFEMETFHLLHMAACSGGTLRASAAAIALGQRRTNEKLPVEEKKKCEKLGGQALINVLTKIKLNEIEK